jgi:hypothetical protein
MHGVVIYQVRWLMVVGGYQDFSGVCVCACSCVQGPIVFEGMFLPILAPALAVGIPYHGGGSGSRSLLFYEIYSVFVCCPEAVFSFGWFRALARERGGNTLCLK